MARCRPGSSGVPRQARRGETVWLHPWDAGEDLTSVPSKFGPTGATTDTPSGTAGGGPESDRPALR